MNSFELTIYLKIGRFCHYLSKRSTKSSLKAQLICDKAYKGSYVLDPHLFSSSIYLNWFKI
jgi:hypothetical protein